MYNFTKRYLIVFASIFLIACGSRTKFRCGTSIDMFPKFGKNSKIVEFKFARIENTLVNVEGKIFDKSPEGFLPGAEISLIGEKDYQIESDRNGKFLIKDIAAGKYVLKAKYVGFRELISDTIELNLENLYTINIEMGSIGQNDFSK